jgi:DNA-binding HxlR family transcriptional regulator
MKYAPKYTALCPVRTTQELIGGKWKLLILFQLKDGAVRPSQLRRMIPDISEKMLIQELKNLVDSSLVIRINYREIPPRVEYQLTENGKRVLPLIDAMVLFAEQYEYKR